MEKGERRTLPKDLIERFKEVSTSTLNDVMDEMGINGIITGLRCLVPGNRIVGPAFTVKEAVGTVGAYDKSDFPVGEVINLMEEGDIFVADMGGHEVSTMGGLGSLAMKLKGVAGIVVDGGVRDVEQMIAHPFPAYVAHTCATSGKTRVKILAINKPVKIRGIRVNPGDIIVADDTSVAAIPLSKAEDILKQSLQIENLERQMEEELRKGKTFLEASKKFGVM